MLCEHSIILILIESVNQTLIFYAFFGMVVTLSCMSKIQPTKKINRIGISSVD